MDYRIEQLRYLLREDPSSRIFFQLGEMLRREGEPEEAEGVLRSGLERHPRYVAAWVSLGRTHRDLGDLDEAERAFSQALEIDRENPMAARLLGETAVEREDWLGAIKAFKLTRGLAGADEELDAQIAFVEERLAEDGRLEGPAAEPAEKAPAEEQVETEPPARNLEIVSLSADDPFSDESGGNGVWEAPTDVFEVVETTGRGGEIEAPPDGEIDADAEPAAAGIEVEETSVPDVESEHEETEVPVAAAEVVAGDEPDEGPDADAEAVKTEEPPPSERPAGGGLEVDESSVGAWSESMRAAGVTGEAAWREPTADLVAGDDGVSADRPWAEPSIMAAEASELPADESVEAETEAGTGSAPAADATEETVETDDAPVDDEALPGEDRGLDSIAVTRPIPVGEHLVHEPAAPAAETVPDADDAPDADAVPDAVPDATPDADAVTDAVPDAALDADAAPDAVPDAAPDADAVPDAAGESDPEIQDETEGRHELVHGVPLPTMTLAKLALEQGDLPLAVATLESLIERDPSNSEAADLLDRLRAEEASAAEGKLRAAQATTKIAALQGWLDAVRLAAERRVQ
jgi:hypothetical protein